jgi:microcystin-dependent protein
MEPYIGEIRMFGGNFAPRGWMLCDGTAYNPNTYSQLFSLIMNYYGGDGHSSFNVPDLRGRSPIQWGKGPGLTGYEIGRQAGYETVSLSVPQLPAHNHSVNAHTVGTQPTPANNYLGTAVDTATGNPVNSWTDATPNAVMNPGTIGMTGTGIPVNIVSPILAITYIIAYEGIYPPRP